MTQNVVDRQKFIMPSRSRSAVYIAPLLSLRDSLHQDLVRVRDKEPPLDVLLEDGVDRPLVGRADADESPWFDRLARSPSPAGDVPEGFCGLLLAGKSQPHQLGVSGTI